VKTRRQGREKSGAKDFGEAVVAVAVSVCGGGGGGGGGAQLSSLCAVKDERRFTLYGTRQ
jgi:hypothetical protein